MYCKYSYILVRSQPCGDVNVIPILGPRPNDDATDLEVPGPVRVVQVTGGLEGNEAVHISSSFFLKDSHYFTAIYMNPNHLKCDRRHPEHKTIILDDGIGAHVVILVNTAKNKFRSL